MARKTKSNRGFTLIELLVTLSIVGLLSSLVLTSTQTVRAKARDAQRIQSLNELKTALMLYYEKNGVYPSASGEYSSAQISWNTATNPLYALVIQGFISRLPIDPKNTPANNVLQATVSDYSYYYSTNDRPQFYDLLTRLENSGHPASCEKRGLAYCTSWNVWDGWEWGGITWTPDGDKLVYYHE